MSKYDVSYGRLCALLTPVCLRGGVLLGLLRSLVSPLGILHAGLMSLRKDSAYRLTHSGQVFSLRNVLNDRFDSVDRGITITDNSDGEGGSVTLRPRDDEQPVELSQEGMCLYRRGYGETGSLGFWVNVPSRLSGLNENELRALVNTYKLAGTRYAISYI